MDLSKAYDCLPHDLLTTKLDAYGHDKPSLTLVNGYLHFWTQRKKNCSLYSDWANINRGIPQRSILGPLLFNNFINNVFLFIKKSDICKFAHNNT